MNEMTREQMIEQLEAYCHEQPPLSACTGCKIRRRLAQGYGCIKIRERSDAQLAADIEKIRPEQMPIEPQVEEHHLEPVPVYSTPMVTVQRDMLNRMKGAMLMLAAIVESEPVVNELMKMCEAVQMELDAFDRETTEANAAMLDALDRAESEARE